MAAKKKAKKKAKKAKTCTTCGKPVSKCTCD